MATVYGPSDTLVPDGYDHAGLVLFTGTFPTGTVVTCSWSSVTAPVGWTHPGWEVNVVSGGTLYHQFGDNNAFPDAGNSQTFTIGPAGSYVFTVQGGGGYANTSFLTAHALQLSASSPAYCADGTEAQPAAQFLYYLTPGLIDVWLTADGLLWLAPLFSALWFSTVTTSVVCGEGPPPLPAINLDTLSASIDTITQVLYVVMWPNVCRCKAGTPTPTPFPAPAPVEPPGWPSLPTFGCSNTDVCAALVQIQAQVAAIQKVVGADLGLTTLLQRYRLPFATISGAAHSMINGSGSFAISRLVGMQVTITTPPAGGRVLEGNPAYVWSQGWMSILDGNGFIQERRITASAMTWLPDEMADAITFGYFLEPGVVATFTELEAEP
jgi:hypothetical protein